ncbi:serine/threonine protein kinase [Hyalangium versicolor]|uniref:serine/threonine protein kinase n=1 Tax=Hyalangium versicolor TaxID=2861190 RepID=UPI001CCFE2F3|nr:serine/threonine-protein kinase [Hyalangium versicolor]
MSSQPDPTNLPPGTFIQGWRVVEKRGQGAYGVVYRAQLRGQDFALKIAQHRADSGDSAHTDERIRREMTCLNLVNHPNIVRVWGHGRWLDPREGFFFIVEDYVDGDTLAGWAEHAHPTFRQVVALLEPVADALEAAHQDKIFHRDIKPSNIMVHRSNSVPVITDFSVGEHPLAEELTEGMPPGTRRYRSPEALKAERQHEPGARYSYQAADELFALGATLYDILTDPLPTERRARLPLNNEALPPPSPVKVNPRVPPALSDLTMALLNPNPRLRPPSAGTLRGFLAELKADPDQAWDERVYPPSARRRTALPPPKTRQGLSRQGWARTALLGCALLALLLGAITFFGARGVDLPAETPASHAPQQRPLPKEDTPVSPVSPKPKPTFTQCAALIGTMAFLEMGCATVHTRPEPGECPEEAMKFMRKFGQPNDYSRYIGIVLDPKKRNKDDSTEVALYENGPITSEFDSVYARELPEGTLLEGHLWVAPGNLVFGRYTRARRPDGTTVPICVELCNENNAAGWPKDRPDPREGAALLMPFAGACFTERWH